jgi:hypothetical protein
MEIMQKEESIRRWSLVKMYCEKCPKHGSSSITVHRTLALSNANEIFAKDGLGSQKAEEFIQECGANANCDAARDILKKP